MSNAIGIPLPRLSRSRAGDRQTQKYAVNGKVPGFTADFIDNYYSGHTSLSSAITHSRSGNAVMTDGYGPELVVNGGFDSDISGWTEETNGDATHFDSKIRLTVVNSTNNGAYQELTTESGKTYIVTALLVDVDSHASATIRVGTGGGGGNLFSSTFTEGVIEFSFTATSSTSYITLRPNSTTNGNTAVFDNVSVREMPVLKWAPHNLAKYSEEFDNAVWSRANTSLTSGVSDPAGGSTAFTLTADGPTTNNNIIEVVSGAVTGVSYTNGIWIRRRTGTGTIGIYTAGAGLSTITNDVTSEWKLFTTTASAGSANIYVGVRLYTVGDEVDVWGAHVYRSDLGGMVDNPDRGDSYVPTTSSAKYLSRVGHHVYNGSAWVNAGLLAESEARTNLITRSQDFSDAYWAKNDTATLSLDSVGPDGQEDSAVKLIDDSSTGTSASGVYIGRNVTVDTSSAYTFSVYAKKDQLDWVALLGTSFTTPAIAACYFDLDNGVISQANQSGIDDATIQDVGNGWYRCSITFTTDATDTSGQVRVYVSEGSGAYQVDLDGTSSILIYGAQFEKGSTPSSLIPTSGSTVTRPAETFTIPSANLPWPEPSYIGSELVTNGTFDTDSDWTKGAGWSISGGTASSDGTQTANSNLDQTISTTSGSVYHVTFDLTRGSGGLTGSFAGHGSSGQKTASGSYEFFTIADSSSEVLRFVATSSFTGSVDNISVREINPLSVSIAMDGAVTYADDGETVSSDAASGTALPFRWRADSTNYITHVLSTETTNVGTVWFMQEDGGTFDYVLASDVYSPDINVPFDIASRHGSTFVNGAVDGVALTANTTPTALADLETTDLNLAQTYMGTIGTFRVWDKDLGDDGIVEATNPSLEPSLSLTFEGTGTNSFVVNNWSE